MLRSAEIDPERVFDIIIVGGGATGAGCARDAALRGLSALLLEKNDFASGVTSKTTRLIHGGLRYLANFEMDLVAESLRERSILRRLAPHLIRPIPIIIPIYKGDPRGWPLVSIGIHLYDLLSHEKDIPRYFTSGKSRTLAYEPRLNPDGLIGSALFYDHQIMMPERLVMENIISAREAGAAVLNHHRVEKISEENETVSVTARDVLAGETRSFRSRTLINAAGPWIDSVRKAGGIDQRSIIHPTKGIHLVLPKLSEQALFVSSRDQRMFFIIPLGGYSLIGTTDTNYYGDLDDVHANMDDVSYLLSESRRILPGLNLTREAIHYTYAGIRPLAFSGRSESKISRKHRVIREGRLCRIITIAGGKLTTYRNMARDAVDAASRTLGRRTFCITDKKAFPGGPPEGYEEYLKEAVPDLSSRYKAAPDTVRHLISLYGSRAERILEIVREEPPLGEAISPESRDIYAQVAYSVIEEGAKTLSDIALRRMHIGITSNRGGSYADRIAEVAGKELKWNDDELRGRVAEFKDSIMKNSGFLKQK